MSKEIFKKFEEQFGSEWSCNCGSCFEPDWVELVSQTKTSILTRYTCQICGREQMFAVSISNEKGNTEPSSIDLPRGVVTSDDTIDIREELNKMSFKQIRLLDKKKIRARVTSSKITHL